jgi:hypothetical protein
MARGLDVPRQVQRFSLLDSKRSPCESRRRFVRGVLAGAALAIIGTTAGFTSRVIASEYMAPSGTSPSQATALDVGRLKVATEDFAKFTIRERDQTHALFNNTWATPNDPHTVMIAGLSSAHAFEAHIAWDWPSPTTTGKGVRGYHAIYHGLDPAAGICTDSRFPFQISQHSALKLDIPNVTVRGEGVWGLAFDLFLFKNMTGNWWESSNVQAEIFILLKRQGRSVPSQDASLYSSGIAYGHGRSPRKSNLHVFWREDDPDVPFRQTIDIYDFINFLKNQGFASDTNILTMTDLGVEPTVGSGVLTLDSYYITLC